MANRKEISNPKIGMNRATSPHLVSEGEYLFQLNGNSYDSDGEKFNLTDEISNILATKFKEGFKFIGGKNHIVRNKTYIFLTNPSTGVSEIGYIYNDKSFTLEEDTEKESNCKNCPDYYNQEPTPLENQTQVPHQLYETLIEDSCNFCLGFNIKYPIIDIIIKEQNVGTKMFWTSTPGNKELRYIELDDLDRYKVTGEDNCGEVPVETCLDCDKLRVFRLYTELKVKDYERTLGGNLKKGSYEILGAYSDILGNEFTSYVALTPIIPIFDEANVIHEQIDDNSETNFSIKLELDNSDVIFDYYKIAVRYFTSKGVFESFVSGVYNTSNKTVIISDDNGDSISNNKLLLSKPFVETVDGITSSNNILFLNGIKEREPINLQPVINLAGLGVKWMSFRAKEELYSNSDSYKYLGYNRDENLALAIDFGMKDGYRTNSYIFIPRPPSEDELSDFNSGDDYDSITDTVGDCDGNLRTKKWQFYNTATEIGTCPAAENIETTTQTENISTYTSIEVPSVSTGELLIELSNIDSFTNLAGYIEEAVENNDLSILGVIEPFVDLNNLTAYNEIPVLPANTCTSFVLEQPEDISVEEVIDEQILFNYPINSDEYQSIKPPSNVSVFQYNGTTLTVDEEFSFEFHSILSPLGGDILIPLSAKKSSYNYNDFCGLSETMQRITDRDLSTIYGSFYFNNEGYLDINDFLESSVTMPVSVTQGSLTSEEGEFFSNLHKHALWFKTEVFGRDKFYINISKDTLCQTGSRTYGGFNYTYNSSQPSLIRISIFDKCTSTTPLFSQIYDIDDSHFITVDSSIINLLTNDDIFVSIEAPIISTTGLGEDWEDYVTIETEADGDRIYRYTTGAMEVDTFILNSPCGAFSIVDRDEEPESAKVSWTEIKLSKLQKYTTTCTFEIPILSDCEPVPYKYGELGYFESTDTYPDNQHLYDSSELIINKDKITNTDLLTKLDVYKDSETVTQIILSDEADFRCKNIRHYKMPDNKVSPFIGVNNIASNSDSIISPLGFSIDGEVISNMLDVAVDNNLLTQDQRNNIVNYKIYRSDSTLYRSVVASGLVFNTKSYNIEGDTTHYFNYPFNSLGADKYFPDNEDDPFDKIQAISPEFDYYKPSLPTEMSIQGYMFGKSNSRVLPVEDHSKMVILGTKARNLANTLAIIEVTSEIAIASAQAASNAQVWAVAGLGSTGASFGSPAFIAAGVIAAIGAVEGLVSKVARYRFEWEKSFEDLGAPYNFGYYTASGSNYNYLKTLQTDGDRLRGLSVRKYLKSGMLNVSDTISGNILKINNRHREEAPFFSLGNYPINNLDPEYESFDNSDLIPNFSSQILSSEIGCHEGKSPEQLRNIASPYVAFKNYIPNQYGTINSIKWIDTNYCVPIENTGICDGILGGDTFISRHSKKRKARMFETDLLGSADLTPFPYRYNSNYGDPRYYIDYKINSEFESGSKLFPSIFYDISFDCNSSLNGFYVEPPGKFYLYNIAFTNFLCETRINTNFRNARKEPWNQFYPQNTDYETITQPTTVPLSTPENYYYNRAYLQTEGLNTTFLLPEYYSVEVESLKSYNKNSVMYSLPDVNENSITEPWLLYRPNDKATLESTYGNLINIKGIESDQILLYFENAMQLQNVRNPYTDGQIQYNTDLGNGGIFGKRAITLKSTDLGYAGSQSKSTLSCEFGHFHVDIIRGQVFRYTGGNNLEEISRYSNGKPNGMDVWFKEHLPLKFDRYFPEYFNSDNPYNSVGIHWGYDSKYRRIILTKKDYILNTTNTLEYDTETELFTGDTTFQDNVDNGNFKEVSWTITYKPETGSWESYMSYTPNYYINHPTYFQSGINSNGDDHGLWSHVLTNKSYRVFYGQKNPYIIEYPIKNEYFSKSLVDLTWNALLKRYHNEYDYAPIIENPFTKVNIYNNYETSGDLIPVLANGTLSQLSKYPVTNSNNTQDVLVSYDDYRYNMNYFYNRVKSNKNNQPIWIQDENQINKELNKKAVSFYGKKTLERLKGNFFIVRLERDGNTNLDLDFRWSEQTTSQDN